MWRDLYLRKFVVRPDKVKRVADYVRYRTNTVWQTGLHNLPDESDEYAIAYLANTTSSHRVWDENETSIIEEFFSSIPTMPKKREIAQYFSEYHVLKYILRREGRERCYASVAEEGSTFICQCQLCKMNDVVICLSRQV